MVCVLKITVLGQVIVWHTREPRQHRNRSARWIGETRCVRTNEDKACSLRLRAGFLLDSCKQMFKHKQISYQPSTWSIFIYLPANIYACPKSGISSSYSDMGNNVGFEIHLLKTSLCCAGLSLSLFLRVSSIFERCNKQCR